MPEDDPVYLEWLAAAPKGVRWDRAQEMYAIYLERRRRQAEDVAKRLLGNRPTRKKCPNCRGRGMVETYCGTCFGTGEVLND